MFSDAFVVRSLVFTIGAQYSSKVGENTFVAQLEHDFCGPSTAPAPSESES